jgi:hypothetical protein
MAEWLPFREKQAIKNPSTIPRKGVCRTGNNLSSQGASTQVLSTRESLTAVFGMGTGGSSQPSSPDSEGLDLQNKTEETTLTSLVKSSPRLISTGPLNASLHLHSRPINLVFFKESYQLML